MVRAISVMPRDEQSETTCRISSISSAEKVRPQKVSSRSVEVNGFTLRRQGGWYYVQCHGNRRAQETHQPREGVFGLLSAGA